MTWDVLHAAVGSSGEPAGAQAWCRQEDRLPGPLTLQQRGRAGIPRGELLWTVYLDPFHALERHIKDWNYNLGSVSLNGK